MSLDAVLQQVLKGVPFQLTTDGGPQQARQRFADLPRQSVHPEVTVADRTIESPGGPLRVRVYRPPSEHSVLPVVVFIHGGGWSVGDLDTYDGPDMKIVRSVVTRVRGNVSHLDFHWMVAQPMLGVHKFIEQQQL